MCKSDDSAAECPVAAEGAHLAPLCEPFSDAVPVEWVPTVQHNYVIIRVSIEGGLANHALLTGVILWITLFQAIQSCQAAVACCRWCQLLVKLQEHLIVLWCNVTEEQVLEYVVHISRDVVFQGHRRRSWRVPTVIGVTVILVRVGSKQVLRWRAIKPLCFGFGCAFLCQIVAPFSQVVRQNLLCCLYQFCASSNQLSRHS
mmetsp:Transcript_50272/g.92905  ORF Transcript_50272/g.92905 Transcript_50272/m.92905 type:complete len:201 (+) Transcript_50272:45-647(+)